MCFEPAMHAVFMLKLMYIWLKVNMGLGRNLLKSSGRKCMFSACELSWKILCVELKIYAEMHGYFSENLHECLDWNSVKVLCAELCISRQIETRC